MRRLPYLWLDVFAAGPFSGNPLCVILDGTALSDAEMQAIAKETNLSETTFVLPPTAEGATYRNRIFTPSSELAFAGHPTLGTAAAVAISGKSSGAHLVQQTAYGLTPIELFGWPDQIDRVVMAAPTPSVLAEPDPAQVAWAIGLTVEQVTPNGLRPQVIKAGVSHLVIPVSSPEVLASAAPHTQALVQLSRELGVIGAYPFALLPEGGESHARARLFAPFYGIPEDAATGSAAAPLGFYLNSHGLMPAGSSSFWYEQGIEMGRPSRLWVEVNGTEFRVGGEVVLLGSGEFNLPR